MSKLKTKDKYTKMEELGRKTNNVNLGIKTLNKDIKKAMEEIQQMPHLKARIKPYTKLMEDAKEIFNGAGLSSNEAYKMTLNLMSKIEESIQNIDQSLDNITKSIQRKSIVKSIQTKSGDVPKKMELHKKELKEFSETFDKLLNQGIQCMSEIPDVDTLKDEIMAAKEHYLKAPSESNKVILDNSMRDALTKHHAETVKDNPKISSTLFEKMQAGFAALFTWLKSFVFTKPPAQPDKSTVIISGFKDKIGDLFQMQEDPDVGPSTPRKN